MYARRFKEMGVDGHMLFEVNDKVCGASLGWLDVRGCVWLTRSLIVTLAPMHALILSLLACGPMHAVRYGRVSDCP